MNELTAGLTRIIRNDMGLTPRKPPVTLSAEFPPGERRRFVHTVIVLNRASVRLVEDGM